MRRLSTLLFLFLLGVPLWSQESYSLEGTVGSVAGTPETYSISMVGRVHFNPAVSAGLGVGLWNSGFSSSWLEKYGNQTATMFRISDNQTVPSFQVNLRGNLPLFSFGNIPIDLIIEPALHFLPSTARNVTLSETYFTGTINPVSNELEYDERSVDPRFSASMVTDNSLLLGWELKGGLSFDVAERVACAFSCAYQQVDLFHSLRTATLNTHESNNAIELQRFSPKKGRVQLQMSFIYRFPLK